MGEKEGKPENAAAGTLEEALVSLEGAPSLPPGPTIFDAPTIMPPPSLEGSEAQPPTTELSFTERINLEESLLENASPELRGIAAGSLAEIAGSTGCSIIYMRRILDILTHHNKENEGKFSEQLRKVKRCFSSMLGRPFDDEPEDPDFVKRDTLPFTAKPGVSGTPRQAPQPPVVDTTEKIQRSKAKR